VKVFARGKSGYNASGIFESDRFTVLKGSKISQNAGKELSESILKIRLDDSIIDQNGYLKKDTIFKSASTAASFVTGHSSNGLIVWKLENGDRLGDHFDGKKTKPKKEVN
jgi:hypothetical protein